MLQIPKNKFVITYLSFVGGFLMIFTGKLVMAVVLPQGAPLNEFTGASVHSMDIAGGYNAADGTGVSINNDGKFQIKTRTLTGSYANPNYGFNISSKKGGLHVISPYNPIAGRNNIKYGKAGDPNEYGRVGVEGRVVGDEAGDPDITKGFLGYVQHASYDEYQPIPDTSPNSLIPYAFYTTGNTYLGDTVTVNGVLKNPNSGVTIAGNTVVQGNVEASRELETDTLNFSNVANLDAKFLVTVSAESIMGEPSSDYPTGTIFPDTDSCTSDAYLVGCSGYVTGADSYAPYRGAKRTSASAKGGTCTAWAKSQGSSVPFYLFAVAYCFDPN